MAAVTTRLSFATGILILPQRQTALVAKQAAALDVISGGRLRLGVGIGWNAVEFVALGEDFHRRGRRIEAQVQLLRRLWTEPLVTENDEWHTIPDAGINPLPVQRPIPIWFGGHADPVLQRVAILGDGWMPGYRTADAAEETLGKLDKLLATAGRARSDIGIEPRLHYQDGAPEQLLETMAGWQAAGANDISLNTMACGFEHPDQHLGALRTFAEVAGLG